MRVVEDPEEQGMFWIEGDAMEPTMAAPVRLFDLRIPKEGVEESRFAELLAQGGLTKFRHSQSDSLVMGGPPGAARPDTAIMQGQHLPVIGRNDACSCGSGKKYKRCCLQ